MSQQDTLEKLEMYFKASGVPITISVREVPAGLNLTIKSQSDDKSQYLGFLLGQIASSMGKPRSIEIDSSHIFAPNESVLEQLATKLERAAQQQAEALRG